VPYDALAFAVRHHNVIGVAVSRSSKNRAAPSRTRRSRSQLLGARHDARAHGSPGGNFGACSRARTCRENVSGSLPDVCGFPTFTWGITGSDEQKKKKMFVRASVGSAVARGVALLVMGALAKSHGADRDVFCDDDDATPTRLPLSDGEPHQRRRRRGRGDGSATPLLMRIPS
jgi:hypothetical protein